MADPSTLQPTLPSPSTPSTSLSTLTIHADDPSNHLTDVAPPLHVSTTFRYSRDPARLNPLTDEQIAANAAAQGPGSAVPADAHIYSRVSAPNTSRLELILTSVLGQPSLAYGSGLAAFHALLVWLHPKVVAIGDGYHGCHGVLKLYQKLTGCQIVDLHDEESWGELGKGDVVHLETPVNPTGKALNIERFAELAHARGAWLTIDATFAPPPLLDPFKWGADFVMHSGTKYFGGHSDLLCGVVGVGKGREGWEKDYWGLFGERICLGSAVGSLEGWLGVRSLRTLELRVMRQSENAGRLVGWLDSAIREGAAGVSKVVQKVEHASLQKEDMEWLSRQMPNGFGPVFSVWMKSEDWARRLPSKLEFFHHATSLGGVESLIEWRKMSDQSVEGTLMRISVGIENWEDLKGDLERGFAGLVEEEEEEGKS
ncbi:cystathionine gamma-synthase like protein [Zymoseptoria brevis]|uniref:Cystathionine gamma-synthase like protein n=1 Tax=Zymoseptoria brevis TaxID=1047168 RepID=A0A0F4GSD2_9PEZI|nr:cystathionine gamma-synthase like protein [Zymoseptoria brevis]